MFGVAGLRCRLLSDKESRPLASATSYALWCTLWLAGHVVGAALLGAALGAAGAAAAPASRPWIYAAASIACLGWSMHHFDLWRAPMPQWHRQVQRGWMTRYPWNLVAFGYGLQLGCAVLTRIGLGTIYAVMICALLSGSAFRGALFAALFGLTRALPAVIAGPLAASPERSLRLVALVNARKDFVVRINALVLLVASCLFAVAAYA